MLQPNGLKFYMSNDIEKLNQKFRLLSYNFRVEKVFKTKNVKP